MSVAKESKQEYGNAYLFDISYDESRAGQLTYKSVQRDPQTIRNSRWLNTDKISHAYYEKNPVPPS